MLQQAVDAYLASALWGDQRNQNTILAYRNDLYQVCTYFEQRHVESWSQITCEHIIGYVLKMRLAYRPTTVARKLAALKSFFRHLQSTGVISLDPIKDLKPPRAQKESPVLLTVEQMQSLFRQVEVDTVCGQRDFAILHLLCATGMRVTEIVSLNLADLDMVQSLVSRPATHRRDRCVLPLSPLAVEAIQHYIEQARPQLARHHPEEQALFVNHHGERLTRQGLWLIIKGYARRIGLAMITPHMLRQSFAVLLPRHGTEPGPTHELLGEAHISTARVYSELDDTRLALPV